VAASGTATALTKSGGHHWSDWVGFVAYLAMAVWMFVRSASLGILMLPIFCYEILIAGSFLIRRPLRAQLPGWKPQVAAYVGSFLPLVFMQASGLWFPRWMQGWSLPQMLVGGRFLWFWGLALGIWTMFYLRRAFSLVPQARVLVTSGPYRLARHPIYLSYFLQYLGIWLAGRITLPFTVVLLVWFAVTYWRTRFEEEVLSQAFPDYELYRRSVGRFGPRLVAAR
jgi:protein-S-isoprenylcysteine O-methyltransferase Ste14